ncbi:MAG: lysophospholipase [Bacteroidota bacterium]
MIRTTDGLLLYTRAWEPAGEVKGRVLLVHGYADHSGRFEHVASALNDVGLAVDAFDWRGHGRSEGPRAYVDAFQTWLDDLAVVYQAVRASAGQLPVFLMGHSGGGLQAAAFALRNRPDLAGVVLSSPALKISEDISPVLQRLSGVVARIAPTLKTVTLDASAVSRDSAVVQAYKADPLVYHEGTKAATGHAFIAGTKWVEQHAASFRYPLYVFHGSADRLTDPAGSKAFVAQASSSDKTLRIFEGLYHETMNEPEQAQVLAELQDWFRSRSGL